MIKLNRPACPDELTTELVESLTDQFRKTRDNVWSEGFIRDALINMSGGKCSYCETMLGVEGKHMHVEHFHHKDGYPDKVVEWTNLLPSCNRCNSNKGTHDTVEEPIINPAEVDPRLHLRLENFRYKPRDNSILGKTTIGVIYLNDTDQLINPRFEVANEALSSLEELLEKAIEYDNGISRSTRRKNIIVNGTKSLLRESLPSSEYSAIVATVLLNDSNYYDLKSIIQKHGYWDNELISLEAVVRQGSLYP